MIEQLTAARGRQPAVRKQVHLLLREGDRFANAAQRIWSSPDKPSNWIDLWVWASERANEERNAAMKLCERTGLNLNRIVRNRPRRRQF